MPTKILFFVEGVVHDCRHHASACCEGRRSLQTARAVRRLAADLGIHKVYVVGNKIREEQDRAFILEHLPGDEVLGFVPFTEKAITADMQGIAIFDADERLVAAAKEIQDALPV